MGKRALPVPSQPAALQRQLLQRHRLAEHVQQLLGDLLVLQGTKPLRSRHGCRGQRARHTRALTSLKSLQESLVNHRLKDKAATLSATSLRGHGDEGVSSHPRSPPHVSPGRVGVCGPITRC